MTMLISLIPKVGSTGSSCGYTLNFFFDDSYTPNLLAVLCEYFCMSKPVRLFWFRIFTPMIYRIVFMSRIGRVVICRR